MLTKLLAIESPFPEAHSMLRFLEPPGSCPQALWTRLFAGTYDKPFIVDSSVRRFLHFDLDCVQSAMDLARPDRLTLAYTRKMMAFLLFNRAPDRILLLGLGGGSLAKFCYRHLPSAAITAVEPNPDVIALREAFRIPADDERFRVMQGDGAAHVSQLSSSEDVILADACDRNGIARELDDTAFYENARRSLTPAGIFVMNVCGIRESRAAHLLRIRQVFGEDIFTLPVKPDGNVIVFALKEGSAAIRAEQLAATALDLKRQVGLDFPRYARRFVLDLEPASIAGLRDQRSPRVPI
jgi:spermidine synthase